MTENQVAAPLLPWRGGTVFNSTLAQHALALLARLFRHGEISYHGGFVNLETGGTSVSESTRRSGGEHAVKPNAVPVLGQG